MFRWSPNTALRCALLSLLATGCAARVRVEVPASSTLSLDRDVAIVAESRACGPIADALAERLREADVQVRPSSFNRITVYACNVSWAPPPGETSSFEGRGQAIASVTTGGRMQAQLLGASRQSMPHASTAAGLVRYDRRTARRLQQAVALDLAEQVTPVPLVVHRRIYPNSAAGSARSFHNLAVAAERGGQLDYALWWARQAQEAHPSRTRARYVSELSRRLDREGASPL